MWRKAYTELSLFPPLFPRRRVIPGGGVLKKKRPQIKGGGALDVGILFEAIRKITFSGSRKKIPKKSTTKANWGKKNTQRY